MLNIVMCDKIYLDYAAGTHIDPHILNEIIPLFSNKFSNASSMYSTGRKSRKIISKSREIIAECINSDPNEIIFTGSGTEADNLAILGGARANKAIGNHIIISSIEHKAVTESAKQLEKEGFKVSILPVDNQGLINITDCINLINNKTILISVMYANNEIGTIEPIKELSNKINKYRKNKSTDRRFPILHTDACQAAGYLDLDVKNLGVDMMTLNSTKIYGPSGVGLLFKKENIKISPIVFGGEQEKGLRAGTENIALIHGFALALKKSIELRDKEAERLRPLRDYFIKELYRKIPDVKLNGHESLRLPNNIHISIPRVEGESMVLMLDDLGIEVATGSACSTFDLKPSHVLGAIGQDSEIIHGSLRFTMGRDTTIEKIDRVLEVLPEIVNKLSIMSPIK